MNDLVISTLLLILIAINLKIIKQMATAQETLEQFVTELNTARDLIIARIESIINNSGDLVELLTPIKEDLTRLGNPEG